MAFLVYYGRVNLLSFNPIKNLPPTYLRKDKVPIIVSRSETLCFPGTSYSRLAIKLNCQAVIE